MGAALLRSLGKPWGYKADAAQPSYTVIQLILSLSALPVDLTLSALRMIAWLMLNSDFEGLDDQAVHFVVAVLWLGLRRNPPLSDPALFALSEWIVERRSELTGKNSSLWETLGVKFRNLDLNGHEKRLQERVLLVGILLTADATL